MIKPKIEFPITGVFNQDKEIWKDIPGFEGLYQASNLGKIKNKNNKILKQFKHKKGYLMIQLSKNNKRYDKLSHRLIASAFYGNSNLTINHIDGNTYNNKIENLEFCTQSENNKHAFRIGLIDRKGEHNSRAKLKEENIIYIRKNKNNYTQKYMADMFNVSETTIQFILKYKTWRHIS